VSETKHTPGKWFQTPDGFRVFSENPIDALDITIIAYTAHNVKERTEEARANARLIAAAPDLLVALEAVTSQLRRHFDQEFVLDGDEAAVIQAKAALAKVKA